MSNKQHPIKHCCEQMKILFDYGDIGMDKNNTFWLQYQSVVNGNRFEFSIRYCPWCGEKLGKTDD